MKKILKMIRMLLKICCMLIMLLMVVIVFIQVINRNIFDHSFAWVEELACICMVWITFLGAALAASTDSHTRIDFFIKLFPESVTHMFIILGYLLCGAYSAVLIRYGIPTMRASFRNLTPALKIPSSISFMALVAGASLMIIYFIVLICGEAAEIRRLSAKKAGQKHRGVGK